MDDSRHNWPPSKLGPEDSIQHYDTQLSSKAVRLRQYKKQVLENIELLDCAPLTSIIPHRRYISLAHRLTDSRLLFLPVSATPSPCYRHRQAPPFDFFYSPLSSTSLRPFP